jgi:hypothetical protein
METLIPHKEKICHLFRRKKYALLDFKGHRRAVGHSAFIAWLSDFLDSERTVNYREQKTQLLGVGHREVYRI